MMLPELRRKVEQHRLRLERRGDNLVVIPASQCPPELVEALRAHKAELLSWLEARADGLTTDRAPWLFVAKRILGGEFDAADMSTLESLAIGLRSIDHPVCRVAFAKLKCLETLRSVEIRLPA